MSYYIKDTTKNKVVTFTDPNEVVSYLENLCRVKLRKTRKELMFEMESLGHGHDDPQGVNFTTMMGEYFEVRTRRKTKTNIQLARSYSYG